MSKATEIVLSRPGDWVKWHKALKGHALDLRLWKHIADTNLENEDGTTTRKSPEPFLSEPVKPNPADF